MSSRVRIRYGRREDVEQIFSWIVELAEWEIHRLEGSALELVADGAR